MALIVSPVSRLLSSSCSLNSVEFTSHPSRTASSGSIWSSNRKRANRFSTLNVARRSGATGGLSQETDLFATVTREEVDPVDEAHPVAAGAHDEGMRARAVRVERDAAQQVAVRDAGRGHDAVAGGELVGPEDPVDVLDPGLARRLDLAAPRRPELRLELPAEAAERGGGEQRLARPADPDRDVVVRAANRGRDRRRHRPVLDQLDPDARRAQLLDEVVVARAVEDD